MVAKLQRLLFLLSHNQKRIRKTLFSICLRLSHRSEFMYAAICPPLWVFSRWINRSPSSGKLQNVFRYSEWHLSTVALNIGVKTLRENYSCNYKHQLKRLKSKLKLNKWNNYEAYLCDNFWNKRIVEMRKFDCNSFRITVNTNFKKKLTSFVSKSVWGNPAMKVKVQGHPSRV